MPNNEELNEKEIKQEVVSLLERYSVLKQKKELYKMELTKEDGDFYNLITKSLTLLTDQEYQVLLLTYVDNDEGFFDYVILNELCLSRRTYYRIKDSGLKKLYRLIPTTLFRVS